MRGRIIAGLALGAAVAVGFVLWGDVDRMAETASALGAWQIAALLALSLCSYLTRFAKWELYCRVLAIRLPLSHNLALFLSGFTLTATPGKLGEVLKSFLLRRARGVPLSRTAPMVVAERLTDFTALLALTAFGLGMFPQSRTIMIAGLAATALFLGAVACRPLVRWGLGLVARVPRVGKIAADLETAYESMRNLVTPGRLLLATAMSIPAWALEVLEFHLLLGWLGHPISLQAACFIYAGTSILGAVSMLPGGLGAMEGGMTGLLLYLGTPRPTAVTATLVVRLTTLWFAVALGAGVLLLTRHLFVPEE